MKTDRDFDTGNPAQLSGMNILQPNMLVVWDLSIPVDTIETLIKETLVWRDVVALDVGMGALLWSLDSRAGGVLGFWWHDEGFHADRPYNVSTRVSKFELYMCVCDSDIFLFLRLDAIIFEMLETMLLF